ncbi:MAG: hexitol phosphatase HxpB [bacterium]|nr:hexitol phosphatase HxpB [bacterium]
MIKAIIFDMDGLLIDSEPLWEEAEINSFTAVRVPLTSEMTKQTMGFRVDEVVEHWYARYPWREQSKKEVEAAIVKNVIDLIKEKGKAREGVNEIIQLFTKQNLPMGIASSSQTDIINAVVEKLSIADYMKVTYSAEYESYGKPHPGVYITAAKELKVVPENCLAFEDSPNGVLAAKAAKMKCIAIPDPKMKNDKRFCIADRIMDSLLDFDISILKNFN